MHLTLPCASFALGIFNRKMSVLEKRNAFLHDFLDPIYNQFPNRLPSAMALLIKADSDAFSLRADDPLYQPQLAKFVLLLAPLHKLYLDLRGLRDPALLEPLETRLFALIYAYKYLGGLPGNKDLQALGVLVHEDSKRYAPTAPTNLPTTNTVSQA